MKRPKIALENYEEVYDYYTAYQPPPIASKLAWRAMNAVYKPRVSYVDGAEEEFEQLRAGGRPQIFAFNHLTDLHDQFVTGAVLRQIIPKAAGQARIIAKDSILREVRHKGLGHLGDALGGFPVFRKKDHPEQPELVDAANPAMFKSAADIITFGDSLVIYPEGTHSDKLGKVRQGIGEIASRVARAGISLNITTAGMSFGPVKKSIPRHANVIIGNTIEVTPDQSVEDITESVRDNLKFTVALANELY